MVFAGYSGFFHYSHLASHDIATIGINVTNNKVAYSKFLKFNVLVFRQVGFLRALNLRIIDQHPICFPTLKSDTIITIEKKINIF